MKKYVQMTRLLLVLTGVCFIGGFIIGTISTDTVFIAIGVMAVGMILALSAIYPTAKMIQLQNSHKEERIKKLEEEVERLKQSKLH